MPKITINDESMDAQVGERLLDVARKNAAHIGFVCDGRGLCQTCECQILSGAENLGPYSDIEENTMTESRRQRGYRLGCQAEITGSGPITAMTYVEQVRRQMVAVFKPTEGASSGDSLGMLFNHMTRFGLDFMSSLPYITMKSLPQFMAMPPNMNGMQQWFNDGQRIAQRVASTTFSSGETGETKETPPKA